MLRSKLTLVLFSAAFSILAMNTQIRAQAAAQGEGSAQANAAAKTASSSQASLPAERSADVKAGTKVAAELVSAVDARTAKPGDEVQAPVTKDVKQNGHAVVHKGDRLIGHITDVQAGSTANAGSRLGVTFDRLASGETTSQLNAVLTSVFSSRNEGMASEPGPMMAPAPAGGSTSGSNGGGLLGGVSSSVDSTLGATGAVAGAAESSVGSIAGAASQSTTNATGAVGHSASGSQGLVAPLSAIRIRSESQGQHEAGANSVLSTRHGDLRLDSGTRMEFRVSGSAEGRADKDKGVTNK